MYINYKNKKPQKIYMAEEYEIVINKDLVGKNQTHNVYVA